MTATIATFVQRLLDEQHWSFREQEQHTNVSAQTVYNLTLANTVRTTEVLKLAVAAKYLVLDEEDKRFWCTLEARLREANYPTQLNAEAQNYLSQQVMLILNKEVAKPQKALPQAMPSPPQTSNTQEIDEILALYRSLGLPENRQAVRQLLQSLHQVECVCKVPQSTPRKHVAWWEMPHFASFLSSTVAVFVAMAVILKK